MPIESLLVANRGEIAIRIMRAAGELGIRTVAVHSEDDARNLHIRKADAVRPLEGSGVAPYLDIEQLVAAAKRAGCDAVHPGYGFLAESAPFARACEEAGLTFVGPTPGTLDLFGAKTQARALAEANDVPVVPGLSHAVTVEEAHAFFADLPEGAGMIIKAVGGGGGRGMRTISEASEIAPAFERCASEAGQAFGDPSLYVERWIPRARHVEVQIAGDAGGAVTHFGERDCSVQRRHQKIIEIAPAPALSPALRERITDAAVRLAKASGYRNLGTFEFIVETDEEGETGEFWFIETNARLQVEHTVTEEVTGVDLVQLQLRLAAGESLAGLGLSQQDAPSPRGFAVQARVNMETMAADGSTRPSGGALTAFDIPSGPGVRTDTFGYAGYRTSPSFDSLLAKVVGYSPSPEPRRRPPPHLPRPRRLPHRGRRHQRRPAPDHPRPPRPCRRPRLHPLRRRPRRRPRRSDQRDPPPALLRTPGRPRRCRQRSGRRHRRPERPPRRARARQGGSARRWCPAA